MNIMRAGFGVFALSCVLVGASNAVAQEWYTGARDGRQDNNFGGAIDLSLTGTSKGSMHGVLIGTIAPFSKLEETGMRLRIGGLLGSYSYTSPTAGLGSVTGRETSGNLLGGYEWVARNATFAIYMGGEMQNRTLSKPDPANNATGVVGGFKVAVDFHMNPTPYTMASGNITYSTIHNAYYARFKGGLQVSGNVFAGPEVLVLGDDFYSQFRVGAHLTGAKFGPMQIGVSGGYVQDRRQGAGAYGILDARMQF